MNRAVQFTRKQDLKGPETWSNGARAEESQAAGSTEEVARVDDGAMNAPEMDQDFDEAGEEETKETDEPVDVE